MLAQPPGSTDQCNAMALLENKNGTIRFPRLEFQSRFSFVFSEFWPFNSLSKTLTILITMHIELNVKSSNALKMRVCLASLAYFDLEFKSHDPITF